MYCFSLFENFFKGILNLLCALFYRFPEKKLFFSKNQGLLEEILHPCLFDTPSIIKSTEITLPKCKSYRSKTSAFKLLKILCENCEENQEIIINFFYKIHSNSEWRTKRDSDWNITPRANEKSSVGYVGIKNLACSNLEIIFF